jgi:hypothetical protein
MDHPEVNSTATVNETSNGHAEAWEFALAAGFAADEARRAVFHRSGTPGDESPTENGARDASPR